MLAEQNHMLDHTRMLCRTPAREYQDSQPLPPASDTQVRYLKPLAQVNYQQPVLTTLGKRLLGLEPWPAAAGKEGRTVEVEGAADSVPSVSPDKKRKRDRQEGKRQEGKRQAEADDAQKCNVSRGLEEISHGGRALGMKDAGEQSDAVVGGEGGSASGSVQAVGMRSASKRSRDRYDGGLPGSGLEEEAEEEGVHANPPELEGHDEDRALDTCVFNAMSLSTVAGRSPAPKFLLTFRESQGLQNDADVYLAEFHRRGLEHWESRITTRLREFIRFAVVGSSSQMNTSP